MGLTGSKLEKLLERCGVSVNKNAISGAIGGEESTVCAPRDNHMLVEG